MFLPSGEFDPAGSLGRLLAWNSGGRRRDWGRISKAKYRELSLPHAGKATSSGRWLAAGPDASATRLVGHGLLGMHWLVCGWQSLATCDTPPFGLSPTQVGTSVSSGGSGFMATRVRKRRARHNRRVTLLGEKGRNRGREVKIKIITKDKS